MAYMDMNPFLRKLLAVTIFLANYVIVCANINISVVVNLLGATTIPLMINVFPGYLYYRYSRDNRNADEKWTSKKGLSALAFTLLGVGMILKSNL